jgi:PST family polysaccharide transporter
MRFVALSLIEVVALFVSSVAGIGLAAAGYGHWSLVAWSLILPALTTIGAWLVSGWMPGRPGRQVGVGSMIHFGGTLTLNSVVIYIAYNLDKVLVGRVWGASGLGIYGRAYQLVTLPSDGLMGAVGTVAFSALARVRDQPHLLRSYFLKGYKTLFSLAVPLTIFCLLFAEEIVMTLFGPRWAEATVPFRLLTPLILVFAIINPTGWLLLSIGMVGRSLRIALAITPLAISGYVLGLAYGTAGVAAGFSAAMVLWVVPHLYWSVKGTVVSPGDLFAVMKNPLVAGIAAALITLVVRELSAPFMPPLALLLVGGVTLTTCYAAILIWLLDEKAFFLDLVATLGGRNRAKTAAHPKL